MSLISLNIGARPSPVRGEFAPLGRSAFRVLGLAASASQREVFEAASGLRLALKLGVEKGFETDAAWLGPVARAETDVRDALGRVTDPARRAQERLLWFHAPPPQAEPAGVEDLAAEADALALQGTPAARHDAALLLLAGLSVLDPSLRAPEAWGRCFGLWRGLTEGEEFWSLLVALDLKGEYEQLVTFGEAKELRRRVPRLVTEALAERAKSAAVRGRAPFCRRALVVLRGAGLPTPLLDEYENDILGPLEDRLQEECEALFERTATVSRGLALSRFERGSSYNFAWRTFEYEFKPKLAAFVAAGGAENPSVRRALERAAVKLSELSAKYRANDQPDTALKALRQARLLAPPGSAALLQLEEELRALDPSTKTAGTDAAEYAASLAEELEARREPPAAPPAESSPTSAFKGGVSEAAGCITNVFMLLLMLGGCYLLSMCGVIKPGRSGRHTPPAYNFNYNYNLNFNYNYRPNINLDPRSLNALVSPPPKTTEGRPDRRRQPRRRGNRNAAPRDANP